MRLPKNRRTPPARRGERRSCFRQRSWVDRRTISRRSAGAILATASIGMTTHRRPHPWTTTSSWGRPVSGWARTSSRTPTGCWASSSTRNCCACVIHQPGEPTACSASTAGRSRHLCPWGREWPPDGEAARIASRVVGVWSWCDPRITRPGSHWAVGPDYGWWHVGSGRWSPHLAGRRSTGGVLGKQEVTQPQVHHRDRHRDPGHQRPVPCELQETDPVAGAVGQAEHDHVGAGADRGGVTA
jgi:hypothetical protein